MNRDVPEDLRIAIKDWFTAGELIDFLVDNDELEMDDILDDYEAEIMNLIEQIKEEMNWEIDEEIERGYD